MGGKTPGGADPARKPEPRRPGPDTGGVCVSKEVGGGREECQNHAYIQELEKVGVRGGLLSCVSGI